MFLEELEEATQKYYYKDEGKYYARLPYKFCVYRIIVEGPLNKRLCFPIASYSYSNAIHVSN